MKKLKELAEGIIEESKKQDFDFERNKVLLKSLAVHLTK
jgi:type III secretion system FlhB-like substrate exporter